MVITFLLQIFILSILNKHFLDGDLSITISMVIFIGLAILAIFWARLYPDNRRDPDREFVVFFFDLKSTNEIARLGNGESKPKPDDNNNKPQSIRNGNSVTRLY